uniref:Transposase n=1 Tax=Ascaris lumbricoides TaxID=6252 RepID=A0A0M3IPW2_ASCLU
MLPIHLKKKLRHLRALWPHRKVFDGGSQFTLENLLLKAIPANNVHSISCLVREL